MYLLITFTHFFYPLPPTSGNRQSVLCSYELIFCVCVFWVFFRLYM